MNCQIKITETANEKSQLDELLFEVLWKPLDMPRSARQSFKLDKPETELIAIVDGQILGGLVANLLSDEEVEIHHMAVLPEFQERSIGKKLIEELKQLIKAETKITSVYSRNNSIGFYEKLGFKQTSEVIKQCDLIKHGITCHKMILKID